VTPRYLSLSITDSVTLHGARPNHQPIGGSDPNHQGIWSPPRAGLGPVRNPVLYHRVAPCFPWFISCGLFSEKNRNLARAKETVGRPPSLPPSPTQTQPLPLPLCFYLSNSSLCKLSGFLLRSKDTEFVRGRYIRGMNSCAYLQHPPMVTY
jgi:hypothetical protein